MDLDPTHLLVAALDGALALAQVDAVAVAVAKDLHLHVVRLLNVLLHEHARVAEEGLALVLAGLEVLVHVVVAAAQEDAHAAAAARGLEQHGVAHLGRLGHRVGGGLHQAAALQDGNLVEWSNVG